MYQASSLLIFPLLYYGGLPSNLYLMFVAHASVLTILPDYAVMVGVHRNQAALLLSVIGISNIVGKIP